MPEGYDPRRSQISEHHQGPALATFIGKPITGQLTEIPGIGKENAKKLAAGRDKVTNTHQLIGKYLSFKGPGEVGCKEHCDKFWRWLKSKKIVAYRGSIVEAIAEKANIWMPGLYDAAEYGL